MKKPTAIPKITKTGLVTAGELIRQLQKVKPTTGVVFTEGLHSDQFIGLTRVDRKTVKVAVQ